MVPAIHSEVKAGVPGDEDPCSSASPQVGFQLSGEFGIGGFNQNVDVHEQDCRDDPHPVADPFDVLLGARFVDDVYSTVWNLIPVEEPLGSNAVVAPVRSMHEDVLTSHRFQLPFMPLDAPDDRGVQVLERRHVQRSLFLQV